MAPPLPSWRRRSQDGAEPRLAPPRPPAARRATLKMAARGGRRGGGGVASRGSRVMAAPEGPCGGRAGEEPGRDAAGLSGTRGRWRRWRRDRAAAAMFRCGEVSRGGGGSFSPPLPAPAPRRAVNRGSGGARHPPLSPWAGGSRAPLRDGGEAGGAGAGSGGREGVEWRRRGREVPVATFPAGLGLGRPVASRGPGARSAGGSAAV